MQLEPCDTKKDLSHWSNRDDLGHANGRLQSVNRFHYSAVS